MGVTVRHPGHLLLPEEMVADLVPLSLFPLSAAHVLPLLTLALSVVA